MIPSSSVEFPGANPVATMSDISDQHLHINKNELMNFTEQTKKYECPEDLFKSQSPLTDPSSELEDGDNVGVAPKRSEVESFTNGLEAAEMLPLFPHTLEQLS